LKLATLAGAVSLVPGSILDSRNTTGWVSYVSHGDPDSNKVALTFDDAFTEEPVQELYSILQEYGVKASFFPIGTSFRFPEIWQTILDEGYEVHNHTLGHNNLGNKKTDRAGFIRGWEQRYAQLDRGDYQHPKLLRLPANNGASDSSLYTIVSNLGYAAVIGWSCFEKYEPWRTAKEYDVAQLVEEIGNKQQGGDIVLMHFGEGVRTALPQILEIGLEKGLEYVTLTHLPGTPFYQEPPLPPPQRFYMWKWLESITY